MNAPAKIGDNLPPEPYTLFAESINDLLLEAGNFLDGAAIENEDQEASLSSIFTRLRRERGAADEQRAAEKRPHDEAAKAVQTKWKPLLEKADTALTTANNVLSAFLVKKGEAQRAAAEAAAQEARKLAEAAAQTRKDANPQSLSDQTAVRERERAAAEAVQRSSRLGRAKPQAKGGERAVGLRTSYRAEITDETAFARWAWANRRDEMLTFLELVAERECRGGDKHIPGLIVTELRHAV